MNKTQNYKVTWAETARDVLISAMDKGQLPILFLMTIFLVLISKMKDDDINLLMIDFINSLKNGSILGYVLFIGVVIAWYFSIKNLKSLHLEECKRVGLEKTALQARELLVKEKGLS